MEDAELEKEKLARNMLVSIRDELIANFPYLDRALLEMPVTFYREEGGKSDITIGFGSDGKDIYAIAEVILDLFEQDRSQLVRKYLHTVLHCLYLHHYNYDQLQPDWWDFSADLAVENTILKLGWKPSLIKDDEIRRRILDEINGLVKYQNAESYYRYFRDHTDTGRKILAQAKLFRQDLHQFWVAKDVEGKLYAAKGRVYPAKVKTEHRWKHIEKAVEMEMESYEKTRGYEPGTVRKKFSSLPIKRIDYSHFLHQFATMKEEMHLNLDDFDEVFYTYGLQVYGNMPLIEPLEYREDNAIHDFVIAIDTSGSVQGKLVRGFVKKTWQLLKNESFFGNDMNVYLMQCDARIQEEKRIDSQATFDEYYKNLILKGFGGTDFQPVFARVDQLRREGKLHDLRGLLYFTDGRGDFPKQVPDYPVAFIMVDQGTSLPKVPAWAMRIIVSEDEFREDMS